MALVFQYGSNTSTRRLNAPERLVGDATPIATAQTVELFELDFTVWSRTNGCVAADIVPTAKGRNVWGVIYDIPNYLIQRETARIYERKSLDAIEGKNYQRITIDLMNEEFVSMDQEIITYVVEDRTTGLETSFEYVKHIIEGLREHNIPDDYIRYVKQRVIRNSLSLQSKIEVL